MPRHVALAAALLTLALSASAGETTVRSYAVPGHGSLELDVPLRWREEIGWTPGDQRPTVTFRPEEGSAFVMRIEVLPPPVDAPEDFATLAWLRGLVADGARRSLGIEDPSALLLEQIGEGPAVGFYYSVTDEALPDPPPEGTWRVMTQGASSAGRLVLTSTVLTHRNWGTDLSDALAILRTARISERPADAWRVPDETALAGGGLGERYEIDVPSGFQRLSTSPLRLRDAESGGLFTIEVARRASSVRDELRRLEADVERRAPGAWTLRKRGPWPLAGRTAARFSAVDDVRDEVVTSWAIPLEDVVLTAQWRVHPTHERAAAARVDALLETLRLREPAVAAASPATR